jgi:tRNA(Arg) A34 adenosine deaminase TadA
MPVFEFTAPAWIGEVVDPNRLYPSIEERMRLAVDVARANVERGTGGPFGAAVFEQRSGALLAVGMNQVVAGNCSMFHAEIIALTLAEMRLGSYTLGAAGRPAHQLVASSDPCAMCLGAALWAGVRSIVSGASWDDARDFGFDEGPVTPESFRYLEKRGIGVTRGVLRSDAREVLQLYHDRGGPIYNG